MERTVSLLLVILSSPPDEPFELATVQKRGSSYTSNLSL